MLHLLSGYRKLPILPLCLPESLGWAQSHQWFFQLVRKCAQKCARFQIFSLIDVDQVRFHRHYSSINVMQLADIELFSGKVGAQDSGQNYEGSQNKRPVAEAEVRGLMA